MPIIYSGVRSVGLALPAQFTVTNSPVTNLGTLTGSWTNQTQNLVFSSPNGSSGTPSFRALVASDLPTVGGLTPGSYTSTDLTVDAYGRITAAANGSGGGGGGLTTVNLTLPNHSTSNSTVAGVETITATLSSQTSNKVFASPNGSSGTPTFRALVEPDIPSLFRGAMVGRTTAGSGVFGAGVDTACPWEVADYDTDSFWSISNPTRFTIPSGVTHIRLHGQVRISIATPTFSLTIRKGGNTLTTRPSTVSNLFSSSQTSAFLTTPPIVVSAADYFELWALPASAGNFDATSSAQLAKSYFAIEVLK